MPSQRNNSAEPPQVMTWMKAAPVIAVCVVFDSVRLFFEFFWLMGPIIASAYCTAETAGTLSKYTLGLLGTKTAAVACSSVIGTASYFGSPMLTMFGVVMAIAVGFLGWLTFWFLLLSTNSRAFKQHSGHSLWLLGSFLISEMPIIGSVPALTAASARIYRAQIRSDKEALHAYEAEEAAHAQQERQQRITDMMKARAARIAEEERAYREMGSAGEIPEQLPEAA